MSYYTKNVSYVILSLLILNFVGCNKLESNNNGGRDIEFESIETGPEAVPAEFEARADNSSARTLKLQSSMPLYFESRKSVIYKDSFNNGNIIIGGASSDGVQLYDYNVATNIVVQKIDKTFTTLMSQNHVVSGNFLYFLASDDVNTGLWRLNRTTYEITFIHYAYFIISEHDRVKNVELLDGHIFFTADDASLGRELFSYNISTEATAVHSDLVTGSAGSEPSSFFKHNGRLYFAALLKSSSDDFSFYSIGSANEVPTTITSTSGIQGLSLSKSTGPIGVDDYIYFYAGSPFNEARFFKYSIVSGEFSLVARINPIGTNGSGASGFVEFNNKIYFRASNGGRFGTVGIELWSYDPQTEEAVLVEDVYPGLRASDNDYPLNSSPQFLTVKNDKLYFSAIDGNKNVLFEMNENENVQALDMKADRQVLIAEAGDDLLIMENKGANLYLLDPANNSLERRVVTAANISGTSSVSVPRILDDIVVFSGYHQDYGFEPWVFFTQTNELAFIGDLIPGPISSYPKDFRRDGSKIIFIYTASDRIKYLASYDLETREILVSRPLPFTLMQRLFVLGDYAVFQGIDQSTDTGGPYSVNLRTGEMKTLSIDGQYTSEYVRIGNKLFYSSPPNSENTGLWQFDGASGVVSKISDINATGVRVNGNEIYFVEHDGSRYLQVLYKYSVETQLVSVVKDFSGTDTPSAPYYFAFHNGKIILKLDTAEFGQNPYIYDPVTDSLELMADINPGPSDAVAYNFVSYGSKLYMQGRFGDSIAVSTLVYDDVDGSVSEVSEINEALVPGVNVFVGLEHFSDGKFFLPLYGGLTEVNLD